MVGNKPPKLTIEGQKNLTVRVGQARHAAAPSRPTTESPRARPMPADSSVRATSCPTQQPASGCRGSNTEAPATSSSTRHRRRFGRTISDGGNSPWSAGLEDAAGPARRTSGPSAQRSPSRGHTSLRALAHDGGLIDYDDVTVTVTR